jgi:formylglycine-generating enzyme required for sulfatase activity
MVMVYVPAGEFEMGSTEGHDDEEPVHTVALDAFWLDRTEVTNAQWALCVAAGACRASAYADDSRFNGATQPVVGVSWEDAAAYAAWVGGRLPTEAEWEYAARGPESLVYPWGNEWETGLANCWERDCQDGYEYTAPVGSFPEGASWVGAVDLTGNVWEWVADRYGAYPSSRQVNPTGPASGDPRVLRGGSFSGLQYITRCAFRNGGSPNVRGGYGGFRVVVAPARP